MACVSERNSTWLEAVEPRDWEAPGKECHTIVTASTKDTTKEVAAEGRHLCLGCEYEHVVVVKTVQLEINLFFALSASRECAASTS